jgi:Tol biopolymer transport system component
MRDSIRIVSFIFLSITLLSCNKDTAVNAVETWDLAGRILFQPYGNGPYQSQGVWAIDINTPAVNVTIAYPAGYAFRLSPDSKTLVAIGSPTPSDPWLLFTVGLDRLNVTSLPRHGRYLEWEAGWSPDGAKIVFIAEFTALGSPHPYAICVVNSDGTGFRTLTDSTQSQSPPGWPTWSPDGSKIAYIRNLQPGSPSPAYLSFVTPDGSNQQDCGDAYAPFPPLWSKDGQKIAFGRMLTTGGDTNATRLFVFDTQSNTCQQIAPNEKLTPWGLSWTSTGKLACVGSDYNGQALAGGHSVLLCSPTTLQVEKVLVPGGFRMLTLVSSPDANYIGILGIRTEEEGFALYVVRTDGTGFRFVRTILSYSDYVLNQNNACWIR